MTAKEDIGKNSLRLHLEKKGKIEIVSKVPLKTRMDLSLAYTPGVAEACKEIHKDKSKVYDYTSKGNLVAIVTDGTAVLGLGDIGPEAGLPVMEGKAILFKEFGGVDAFPICLNTKDVEEIISIVKAISPGFGGINLEDISAPRCFEIEERLKKELDIPVFHDDQHGTAVVVLAGLTNSLKLVHKKIQDIKIVMNGAGAAGIAIAHMLRNAGAKHMIMCDSKGAIFKGRKEGMNSYKEGFAAATDARSLTDAMKNADVFIGISVAGAVTREMAKSMNKDSIIFAMANPTPEIMPEEAKAAGVRIIATGRSDYPNQVNNVLAFPGIFRGAFDAHAKKITEKMKLAAAMALAASITPDPEHILPDPLDKNVGRKVAEAVKRAAMED
ncbi:MAG TPA: malic enzyme-like NAD(P)-binding protein [Candidatus Nanoarchaeia archaeon]|nr:malic enzyme-like NAD(P)-binding protein [Candidatus Nanoarchaeia archaeon]